MFNHVRRHQKWLWILISTLVIISFVYFFNPTAQYGSGGGAGNPRQPVGSIGGRPVTLGEFQDAQREAYIGIFFRYQQWPRNDELTRQLRLVERETQQRLFLIEKLKQYNIEVTDEAIAAWITDVFRNPETKTFAREAYDNFVKVTLPQQGLTQRDLTRFIRHDVAIQHLINVAGASGRLVTPQEAESEFREQNAEVEAQLVVFQATNYMGQVTLDAGALLQHYSNNPALYRIPERISLNYVEFPLSNYYAQAEQRMATQTNLAANIDALYAQRGANYYVDTNGQPMLPEQAKAKIREEARDGIARVSARNAAAELIDALLQVENPKLDTLTTIAVSKGLSPKVTAPFTQSDTPPQIEADLRSAFALTPEAPISEEPVLGPESVYVVALHSRIPPQMPPFEEVREAVTRDYQRTQAGNLARNAGQAFQRAATNALAENKSFEAAAQGANHTVIKLPPFSQTTASSPALPPGVDFTSVKNVAFALEPSQVSSFNFTRDGGFVLQVTRKIPVPDAKVQTELPTFMASLRRSRQVEAFNDWFRKEMEATPMTLPGDEREQQGQQATP